MLRIVGDEGEHIAYCIQCGVIGRGSYGKAETLAAIHRTLPEWATVYTLTTTKEATCPMLKQ